MAKKLTKEQNARKQVWQVVNRFKKALEDDTRVLKIKADIDDLMKVIDIDKGEWTKQVYPKLLVQVEQVKILSGGKRKFGSERVWMSGEEAIRIRRALDRAQRKDLKLEKTNPELADELKDSYGTFGKKRSIGSIIRQEGKTYDVKDLERIAGRSSLEKKYAKLEGFRKGLTKSINNALGEDMEIAKDIVETLRGASYDKLEEVYEALNADNSIKLAFVSNAAETGGLLGAASGESRLRILMRALDMDLNKKYSGDDTEYTVIDIEEGW